MPLWWRRNERDCVSNHRPSDCLPNHLFRHRSKKASKLRVTGFVVFLASMPEKKNVEQTVEFPKFRCNMSIAAGTPTNCLSSTGRRTWPHRCGGFWYIYIYIHIIYKQFRIYSYFNDIVYRHASRWIQHLTENVCQWLWITQYIPPWISYL